VKITTAKCNSTVTTTKISIQAMHIAAAAFVHMAIVDGF
jgi:hypothetical protein